MEVAASKSALAAAAPLLRRCSSSSSTRRSRSSRSSRSTTGDVSFPLQGFTTHWYRDVLTNPTLIGSLERSADRRHRLEPDRGGARDPRLVRARPRGGSAGSPRCRRSSSRRSWSRTSSSGSRCCPVHRARQGADRVTGVYIGLGLHAVVIGHVVVSLPYTILTIMPLLERLSLSLDEAAHDLGAGHVADVPPGHAPAAASRARLGVPHRVHALVRRVRDRLVPRGYAADLARLPVRPAAGPEPAAAARRGLVGHPLRIARPRARR